VPVKQFSETRNFLALP